MPQANGTLRQLWLSYHSGVISTSFMNRWLEYADHYERHLPRRVMVSMPPNTAQELVACRPAVPEQMQRHKLFDARRPR